MPPEETLTAPVAEELGAKTPPQTTPEIPQGTPEAVTATPSQVETPEPAPSIPKTERPRPSDFYGFRKENSRLREQLNAQQAQIQQMNEYLQRFNSSAPQAPKVPDYLKPEYLQTNAPDALLKLKEETRMETMQEFRNSFPQIYKELRQTEQLESRAIEAMELILPKDKAGKSLEDRYSENENKVKRVMQIIDEQEFKYIPDPVKKVQNALRVYNEEIKSQQPQRPQNPNVIAKNLMGGTASAQPVGGGKKMPTLSEARAEMQRLVKMRDENPDIRFEDTFKLQMANAKKQVQDLVNQEQGGIKY